MFCPAKLAPYVFPVPEASRFKKPFTAGAATFAPAFHNPFPLINSSVTAKISEKV